VPLLQKRELMKDRRTCKQVGCISCGIEYSVRREKDRIENQLCVTQCHSPNSIRLVGVRDIQPCKLLEQTHMRSPPR